MLCHLKHKKSMFQKPIKAYFFCMALVNSYEFSIFFCQIN